MYELKERNLGDFIAAGHRAYGPKSLFVTALDDDFRRFLDTNQHPTFTSPKELTFFSVLKDGQAVGRIVAHLHRASNDLHGISRSFFGYFDCIDDPKVAQMLLTAAERFGRDRGCDEIVGNFNLTAMQMIGVVTDGFDRAPYTDQVYNPPHIPRLLEGAGYTKSFPMTTMEFKMGEGSAEPVMREKQRQLLKQANIKVVTINRLKLKKQLEHCRILLNDAFAKNPMFVPLTREEFQFQAKDLMLVVDPRITAMAYDGDKPIGAVIAIPDLNPFLREVGSTWSMSALPKYLKFRRKRQRAVIIYYAVDPSYQNQGINGLLLHRLFLSCQQAGYSHVGGTWIADSNAPSLRQAEKMGAKPLHRLHLYGKTLNPCA